MYTVYKHNISLFFCIVEWLHANHKRAVKVKFGPDVAIHVLERKGEKLRTINLKNVDTVVVEESLNVTSIKKPILLLHVPRDYDLVLELDSLASKKKFMHKLEVFLNSNKKNLFSTPVSKIEIFFLSCG